MQEEIQRKITINIPISLYDKILQENGKNLTDKIISILTTYFTSNNFLEVSENKIKYDSNKIESYPHKIEMLEALNEQLKKQIEYQDNEIIYLRDTNQKFQLQVQSLINQRAIEPPEKIKKINGGIFGKLMIKLNINF